MISTRYFKLLWIAAVALVFTACGEDGDDPISNVVGSISEKLDNKANDIKQQFEARSQQITDGLNLDNTNFDIPSEDQLLAEAQRQVGIMTGEKRNSAGLGKSASELDQTLMWVVEEVNGETVPDESLYAFFFYKDGTYEYYSVADDAWEWGYWYADEGLNKVAFDPGTEYEQIFTISELNPKSFTVTDKDGNTVTLNAYEQGIGEIEGTYTEEEIKTALGDRVWNLAQVYVGDEEFTSTVAEVLRLSLFLDPEGGILATTTYDVANTSPTVEFYSYSIDPSLFEVAITDGDGATEYLYLVYAEDGYMVLAQQDTEDLDGDGNTQEIIEWVFSETSAVESTLTSNTWLSSAGETATFESGGTLNVDSYSGTWAYDAAEGAVSYALPDLSIDETAYVCLYAPDVIVLAYEDETQPTGVGVFSITAQ